MELTKKFMKPRGFFGGLIFKAFNRNLCKAIEMRNDILTASEEELDGVIMGVFDLIIYDEIHMAHCGTYSKLKYTFHSVMHEYLQDYMRKTGIVTTKIRRYLDIEHRYNMFMEGRTNNSITKEQATSDWVLKESFMRKYVMI